MNKDFFKKHKYSLIIIILFLIMLPTTIGMPSQTDTRAIVTGVSIDKENDEFTVALQLITPQSNLSNNENIEIVEDKGDTFKTCINNLGIKLGKVVGFEHTNIIIIGNGVNGEDIMNIFDYLFRSSKITLSTIILQSNKSAKKILETSAELNNNSSSSIQNNLAYNNEILETSNTNSIGKFFNDYFSYSKVSIIPIIEEPEEESENTKTDGQGSSGNESTNASQNSQSSGGGEKKSVVEPLIKNNGESAVYKQGVYVAKLDKKLTAGFSFLNKKTSKGIIKVENVTDNKFYYDSAVTIKVESSKIKIKPIIKEDKLVFKADINLYVFVCEVVDKNTKSHQIMLSDETYLTKELKNKLSEKIKTTINNSLNFCKEQKLDIFKFYDKFYKHDKKGLIKILNLYGEDYLDACDIEADIKIYPYK